MPTYSCLHAHLVFSTRDRAPWITNPSRLHAYLGGALRMLGAIPVEIGGTSDHVHILVGYRPSHALSDLVRELKKGSATWAREVWPCASGWQEGFAAIAVSRDGIDAVRLYIQTQEEHHQRISARDEYLQLCQEEGIEVDPRYFT